MSGNKIFGDQGERMAAAFLERKGYKILEKNFRNKLGEIDLVAQDGRVVVFIEVKTRWSLSYGLPFESVDRRKQRKLVLLAQSYLKYRFRTLDICSRFDVVSIVSGKTGKEQISHIPNAFDLSCM